MIVVDTSVAFKWFSLEEANREAALQILQKHLSGETPIHVPDLFYYELTNAWATKTALPLHQLQEYLNKVQSFQIKIVPSNFERLKKAAAFSKKYQVSVYDASYAALAEEKGCDLITADTKFVHKLTFPYIKLL